MNALVPRATIDELVAHRNRSLELYRESFATLSQAHSAAHAASPSAPMYDAPKLMLGRSDFGSRDLDEFMGKVRPEVDRAVWTHLLNAMGMERLMDREARDQFREQLAKDPPEVTAQNCLATVEQLIGDADLIFKRGIANAFSKLDRRFRSHDGFKVGSRMVLSGAFDAVWGTWNHHRRLDETIRDIERTFHVLEGKPQPERYAGIIGEMDAERGKHSMGARAYEVIGEYFKVRVFKNGNVHLWFTRDDLVEKVNLQLADYYGAAVGAGADVADQKQAPSGRTARHFGLFETPEAVAHRVIEEAALYSRDGALMALEPSAGRGRLAKPARAAGATVHCVEIQPELARELEAQGFQTINGDFLQQRPLPLYDRVVMNPPFDRGLDVEHVTHAFEFVKPGGRLVAIMAAGVEYREDRRTVAFRTLVERFGGSFRDLPPGSFIESGTNVNTVTLTLRRPL